MSAVELNASVGGELSRGPIQGGVDKPLGFINREGRFSSGNTAGGVDKPRGFINEQDGSQPADQPENELGLTNVPAVAEELISQGPPGFPAPAPFTKGGRPTVFTPNLTEQICMLLSVGFSRNQAAAYLGIDKSSISRAVARDAALAADLRRAEDISDIHPELTLMAAARKNWRAAAWYLTFKAKNPRPKTEEEKEAEHQNALAAERRKEEICRVSMLGFEDTLRASQAARLAADVRGIDPVTGTPLAEMPSPQMHRKRGRKKS